MTDCFEGRTLCVFLHARTKDFAATILQHLVTVANLVLFLSSVLIKTLWPEDYLKGTQAWDNFEFFFTWIKSLYALRKFSKTNFAYFPSIFARISRFEHFRGDCAYVEPNLFDELSNNFFFKIFTLVLLDGFLDDFWKYWLFIVKICI